MDHGDSGCYCHISLLVLLLWLGCFASPLRTGWSISGSVSSRRAPVLRSWESHDLPVQRGQYRDDSLGYNLWHLSGSHRSSSSMHPGGRAAISVLAADGLDRWKSIKCDGPASAGLCHRWGWWHSPDDPVTKAGLHCCTRTFRLGDDCGQLLGRLFICGASGTVSIVRGRSVAWGHFYRLCCTLLCSEYVFGIQLVWKTQRQITCH
mmetsp:Transcript_42414/g.92065  ORF Transcript_42414/g.92065 Transcript_42414/m.92065 type:complete len:206 (+) Transcript_42414:97-714(+)